MKKEPVRVVIANWDEAKPNLIELLTVQIIKRFEPAFNEHHHRIPAVNYEI